ncbi:3-hydroxyacyl-CoA dehydrogenase NAD-binding domain-containing protein [Candidatus Parabeggiatoa sp. HSG14]|uniref:3-hydroxyacyl-CoA dehydrogenase NAD-binding domain-containing protein n=1 Tax=Candidatus Parabeggiatoa sp. HSG14 TaxID=3055593 RepID=UPI0025A6CF33|nr:3-hydroxyacyl-CoA dehydrogenase NAD-binding domain-containing protein [Thiotrichales bacterium HSG14]
MEVNILGYGLIAKQIISLFFVAGYSVNIYNHREIDLTLVKKEIKKVRRYFTDCKEGKLVSIKHIESLPTTSITIEAIIEELSIKRKFYRKIRQNNNNNYYTNSSSYSPDEIGDDVSVLHFYNPVTHVRLIEYYDQDGLHSLQPWVEFLKNNKFDFLEVNKNRGYLGNYLLFQEISNIFKAIELYGYKVESIHTLYKNLYHNMDIFAIIDVIGVDVCYSILKNLSEVYQEIYVPKTLEIAVQKGIFGKKNKTTILSCL